MSIPTLAIYPLVQRGIKDKSIGSGYDPTQTYSKDALIYKGGKVYIAKQNDITGPWNPLLWDEVDILSLMEEVMSRSGSLSAIGRYLSDWDCSTGLPETDPPEVPYNYVTGDYYIVGNVSPEADYDTILTYDGVNHLKKDGIWAKLTTTAFNDPSLIYGARIYLHSAPNTPIVLTADKCSVDTDFKAFTFKDTSTGMTNGLLMVAYEEATFELGIYSFNKNGDYIEKVEALRTTILYDGDKTGRAAGGNMFYKVSDYVCENVSDLYGMKVCFSLFGQPEIITSDSTNTVAMTTGAMAGSFVIQAGSLYALAVVPEATAYWPEAGTYFFDFTDSEASIATKPGVAIPNYKPSGSSYTGDASTAVDTGNPQVLDMYRYDGTTWTLLHFGNAFRAFLTNYYTKGEADNKFALISALANYYTKAEADAKYAAQSALDNYYTKSETYNKTEQDNKFALKTSVATKQTVTCYDESGAAHSYEINMQEANN